MTERRTILYDSDVFCMLPRGGVPHLLFQRPDAFQIDQLVTLCEQDPAGKETGQTMIRRVTFVTLAGTSPLPLIAGSEGLNSSNLSLS